MSIFKRDTHKETAVTAASENAALLFLAYLIDHFRSRFQKKTYWKQHTMQGSPNTIDFELSTRTHLR